ncbi:histone lysine demethylase JmjC NO66 [Cardiosporidium cionae]|uniref:Bifunctional lysine-specific demethylase and histidyl-hydroxylase n=1 Tax=Cardiosporidium cionae TaxID=476202 RepID=A0ABQ7JBN4_9APIC|nr:histone lysine demethylase JmjC NO66 [Cardiosporidium cionae]|eukprot:KAF8821080.1 histone lysine demethylase JmjC NO66 [Cardiosporidium cionae]
MQSKQSGEQSPEELFSIAILTQHFFRDIWERKSIVFDSVNTQLEKCFSADWINTDDIVAMIENAQESVQLFRRGFPLPLSDIYRAYLDDASIILNKADRCSEKLFNFCQYLATHFFYHTFAVGYLTPRNSFAVRAHSDDQDVFLIQIWGSKHWRVYNPIVTLPYTEEMVGKSCPIVQDVGAPCLEHVLKCGDILYIPRGFIHEAATSNSCSFHITLTIPTSDFCWGIAIERIIRNTVLEHRLSNDMIRFFRTSILMKSLHPKALKDELKQHIRRKNASQKEEYNRMQRLREKRPNGLTTDDIIGLKEGVSCSRSTEEDVFVFRRGDESLTMSIAASSSRMIQQLAQGMHVKVKDLKCEDPFERLCVCAILLTKDILSCFSFHSYTQVEGGDTGGEIRSN